MINMKMDEIVVRTFTFEDIPYKIEWINDNRNNRYLHYDLPLQYDKTVSWFKNNENSDERFDGFIEFSGEPVGLIGLLNVDKINKKAEYYICIGNACYKGKGIAYKSSKLLIQYGFEHLGLNKIYLYTEEENIAAQKLFEKLGFVQEGFLKNDLIYNGKKVNRFIYSLFKEGE